MQIVTTIEEIKNQKKARIISGLFLTALIILLIWPFMTYMDPPPGQEGIMVNLGIPDVGQGDENMPESEAALPAAAEEEEEEVTPEEEVEPVEEEEEVPEVVPEPKEPEPDPRKEIIENERAEALALKKKKEAEKRAEDRKKEQREAEERKKREKAAEEARIAKAEADAKAKAQAEAKARAEALAKSLGGGSGGGKGNTGKDGNQGDPGGNPDSDILTGISTGSGRVGGGLSNRGATSSPRASSPCNNKSGTIVVKICVDADGRVTSADYTQSQSTTTDKCLRDVAIRNARKWKFSQGNVDKQCGTIAYNFKVQ